MITNDALRWELLVEGRCKIVYTILFDFEFRYLHSWNLIYFYFCSRISEASLSLILSMFAHVILILSIVHI